MRILNGLPVVKFIAIPLLFCGVAMGVIAVQTALQGGAESVKTPHPLRAATAGMVLDVSVADLSAAAGKGDLGARIEMGRRFADGKGVAKSESSAISYFRGIINEFDNISAHDKRSQHVAAAFLEMARFYKSGSPEANIAANPAQAFSFLHHAASYFGDPAAQFELAKLMMDGDGVTKNTRVAAQWLLSASRKGYAPAQALLGNILWHGGDGVKRAAGDGLGLLAIARRNALGEDKVWVGRMYETARSEALPIEIMEANAFIVQESAASHLALTNDMLINGTSQEGASVAARALKASPGGPRAPEAISGTSKALTELGAAPLGLPQSALDPEPSAGAKAATAGIIQMYRLRFPDAHIDIPIRYAGVSN